MPVCSRGPPALPLRQPQEGQGNARTGSAVRVAAGPSEGVEAAKDSHGEAPLERHPACKPDAFPALASVGTQRTKGGPRLRAVGASAAMNAGASLAGMPKLKVSNAGGITSAVATPAKCA